MPAPDIIFVVGASRSGTTLMARVLGNHPDIAFAKETQFFDDLALISRIQTCVQRSNARNLVFKTIRRATGSATESQVDEILSGIRDDELTPVEIFRTSLGYLARVSGRSTVVEHTPRNIYYLHTLVELFPQAYFICMVRDPRAVVASQKKRWKQRRLGAKAIPIYEVTRLKANYHLYTSCRLWNLAAKFINDRPMTERISVVRYEDLLSKPDAVLEPILKAGGFDLNSAIFDVPLWGSSHLPHKQSHGIDPSLADHWRKELTDKEQAAVTGRCCALMDHFGYEREQETNIQGNAWLDVTFVVHALAVALLNPRRAWIQLRAIHSKKSEPWLL